MGYILLTHITTQTFTTVHMLKKDTPFKIPWQVEVQVILINKSILWSFFEGACPGKKQICGIDGLLYLCDSHFFKDNACLGWGTNNYAKLMALHSLMLIVIDKGISRFQVFGAPHRWLGGCKIIIIFFIQIFKPWICKLKTIPNVLSWSPLLTSLRS